MTDKNESKDQESFGPTYDELIRELTLQNSQLNLELIALRITVQKLQGKIQSHNL